MNKRSFLTSLLLGTALLFGGEASAQIRERTIRFAHQNSLEHPQGQGVKRFAELVEQRSGGKIKVRQFPNGQLGGDLPNVSALQGGTLDLMVLNAGLLVGIVKDFAALDLPFLFNTPEEADAVVDGPVGQKLFAKLPEKGLIGLGYFELGFRDVTNSRRPVTRLEDLQGIKLRVLQSPLFIDTFNALGTNTVPLPFPELYTALEQKVVDGQENPVTLILDSKFSEIQKHLALTHHIYSVQSVLMSKRVWDRLNDEEKKLIQDALTEAQGYQRQVSREKAKQALDALKAAGMQVTEIAPAEIERMREKVKPVVDKYAREFGEALDSEINAAIATRRAQQR